MHNRGKAIVIKEINVQHKNKSKANIIWDWRDIWFGDAPISLFQAGATFFEICPAISDLKWLV